MQKIYEYASMHSRISIEKYAHYLKAKDPCAIQYLRISQHANKRKGSHTMFELNEQELEQVAGGRHHQGSYTNAQINVQASANGGSLHIDTVLANTKSISITSHGESVSTAVGFAIAIAI